MSKTKSLLIADDVDVNRAILREMFQNEYTVSKLLTEKKHFSFSKETIQ